MNRVPRSAVFALASFALAACGRPAPEPPRNRPAIAVATGPDATCAVLDDGSVRCWGADLTDPGLDPHVRAEDDPRRCFLDGRRPWIESVPRDLHEVHDAVDVSVSLAHACLRTRSGSVRCWGAGYDGELGDGGSGWVGAPTTVRDLANVTAVGTGLSFSCALRDDGTVWCWGDDAFGQLGDGGGDARRVPVQVPGITDATALATAGLAACAAHADGTVTCWGARDDAGDERPHAIAGLNGVVELHAGNTLICARAQTGVVSCWGSVLDENLAPNSVDPSRPVAHDVTAFGVSLEDVCVLHADGTVECIASLARQLRGETVAASVQAPAPFRMPFDTAVSIAVSQSTVCIRTQTGAVQCLGDNVCGELGDGTDTSSWTARVDVPL